MKTKPEYGVEDIDALISDRKKFEDFVYTPVGEAVVELKNRGNDRELAKKISNLVESIPEPLRKKPKAVLFRQLATPNYEVRRFVSIVDLIDGLDPLFWEYYNDKFTSNNEWKHSLGKLMFFCGFGKKNGIKIENENVIEFNQFVGKKISEVKTLWGQSLVEFHHNLFESTYESFTQKEFFDASDWFRENGSMAKDYYKPLITLFVQNAILFENFILDVKELSFTRDVFLPAFIKTFEDTGYKPLIVALEPTELEDDVFWLCHPVDSKKVVDDKNSNIS